MFDKEHHCFKGGKSVTTAGVNLVETIINATDRDDSVVWISKAFDKQGLSLKWFKSYL